MSGGYLYGEQQPTEKCPYCGSFCDADFVDVGVGYMQCGPYHCLSCEASEIGPFDEPRELTDEEQRTGWYKPGAEPGSSANVIDGHVVSHRVAKAAYAEKFTNNPEWEDSQAVADWWARLRQKAATE